MNRSWMTAAVLAAFALAPGAAHAQVAVSASLDESTLTITRAGVTAFQQPIPDVICDGCVDARAEVVQADDDPESDVMVTASTGGAYCCWRVGFYTFDAQAQRYRELARDFGPAGVEIKDLDGDGTPELVSGDIRFEEKFGPHITSFLPPRIYQLSEGVPADVTRMYPAAIRANAKDAKGAFKFLKGGAGGPVAAYVADQYLLGHGKTGLRELDRQIKRGRVDAKFRKKLLALLARYGYR
jgi:hypothetical protein